MTNTKMQPSGVHAGAASDVASATESSAMPMDTSGGSARIGPCDKVASILSAFRGVIQGVHVDVVCVTLSKRPVEPPRLNRAVTADLVNTRMRKHSKIAALVQALADRMYSAGYVLENLDLREMNEQQIKTQKELQNMAQKMQQREYENQNERNAPLEDLWEMKVVFKNSR